MTKAMITNYLLSEFQDIRTTVINGETWFAAIDITKQIGYSNNYKSIKDHCIESGIEKVEQMEGGRIHSTLFINEENICRLVLASKVKKMQPVKNQIFKFIYSNN